MDTYMESMIFFLVCLVVLLAFGLMTERHSAEETDAPRETGDADNGLDRLSQIEK